MLFTALSREGLHTTCDQIVVDRDGSPVATIAGERERGYEITLDDDYATDIEQIVRARKTFRRTRRIHAVMKILQGFLATMLAAH